MVGIVANAPSTVANGFVLSPATAVVLFPILLTYKCLSRPVDPPPPAASTKISVAEEVKVIFVPARKDFMVS